MYRLACMPTRTRPCNVHDKPRVRLDDLSLFTKSTEVYARVVVMGTSLGIVICSCNTGSSSAVYNTCRSTHARLVALKLADALLHLLVGVDAEALVLGDAGQLHVLGVELLLHDLLEGAESEGLGLLEGQAPGMVVSGSARGLRSWSQPTCGTR